MRHGENGWDMIEYHWSPERVQKVYELRFGDREDQVDIVRVTEDIGTVPMIRVPMIRFENLEYNEHGTYL